MQINVEIQFRVGFLSFKARLFETELFMFEQQKKKLKIISKFVKRFTS